MKLTRVLPIIVTKQLKRCYWIKEPSFGDFTALEKIKCKVFDERERDNKSL
jgi:hypothetical protein